MPKKGASLDRMTSSQYQALESDQKLEDAIHTDIADWLTKHLNGFFQTVENSNRHKGWYAALQQRLLTRRGAKRGFPDMVVWYLLNDDWQPRTLCLEVKVPGKDAREEQKAIHAKLQAHGCPCFVVHNIEEVEMALRDSGVPLI